MASSEHQDLVYQQIQMIKTSLRGKFQRIGLPTDLLNKMDLSREELAPLLRQMQEGGREISQSSGIRLHNLIPNAFMIVGGGKVSGNYLVGLGASFNLGLVFMPKRVDRLKRETNEVTHYYEVDWSVIGWPVVNLGGGAGAGARARGGLGLIWGDLNRANEFDGFTIGISASGVIGPVGGNIKAGLVNFDSNSQNKFKYFFVMAQYDGGAAATAEIHASGAYVFNAEQVARALGFGATSLSGTDFIPAN